jgi:hypothetical protein
LEAGDRKVEHALAVEHPLLLQLRAARTGRFVPVGIVEAEAKPMAWPGSRSSVRNLRRSPRARPAVLGADFAARRAELQGIAIGTRYRDNSCPDHSRMALAQSK